MIIKKLFLFASIALLATTTVLPDDEQPEEPQSTTQYIKANLANMLIYITMRLHSTYTSGVNYMQYLKSLIWPKPTASNDSLIIPTPATEDKPKEKPEGTATLQVGTKPLQNMIVKAQPQDAPELLAIVKEDLAMLSSSPTKGKPNIQQLLKAKNEPKKNKKDIEEIDSPAIKKDKTAMANEQLIQLVQHVKELDTAISQLPATEWPQWKEKQTALLKPVEPALKKLVQETIKSSWKTHGEEILKLAIQATNMGVTGALGVFAAQYAKMATGNIETLDTDALLITFLTYASAALIEKTNTLLTSNTPIKSAITAGETNILFQAILAPSIQNKTYQFTMPSFRGVIDYMIMNEAYEVMNTMLAKDGEIAQAIKKINLKQILLGKKGPSTPNMFVSLALPKVKTVINNQRFALALSEVGWIFFQSATLGGLFWAAGLGYANTTLAESVSNAVLTGMAQGVVANVAALTHETTPGALVSISTIPLSQQMVANTGVNIATTPQAVITGVLQAIATEATNFIVNEAEKSGGFFASLQKGKEALGSAVHSRWASTWASITDVWENMQEIEPVPL